MFSGPLPKAVEDSNGAGTAHSCTLVGTLSRTRELPGGFWQTAPSRFSFWHAWKLNIINQDLHFASRHQQHYLDARLSVLDSKVFRCCAVHHDLSVHDVWKLLDFFHELCHLLGLWQPKLISKATSLNYLI